MFMQLEDFGTNGSSVVVLDPKIGNGKGRPPKKMRGTKRVPSAFEVALSKPRHCSRCKGVGHNARSCTLEL